VAIAAPPNDYACPRISPDGTKAALALSSGSKSDIWILDVVRETITRLTFNEHSATPLWTPDGKRIAFSSGYLGREAVYWKAADGTGEDEKLGSELPLQKPWSWSRDGKTLLLAEASRVSYNIGILSIEGDRNRRPLLQEKHHEICPKTSPDGRWMAYASTESGKAEVYVRPFPDVNKGKWQVSTSGGVDPLWSPDGRELFYRNGEVVMAVSVKPDPTFSFETPKTLFRGTYVSTSAIDHHPWDISPDGKRFLMMKQSGSTGEGFAGPRRINIILNWFEELKQRVPGK
jgi:serine/threonine-protein kinase